MFSDLSSLCGGVLLISGTEEDSAFCVGILHTIPFENDSEETQNIVSFSSGI